jgi:polyisoprenoid-binding protein YceI
MMKPMASPLRRLALALLAWSAAASAQETVLRIDAAHTKVEFTLGDVLHTVHGSFTLKRGDLRFDMAGKASGELVVDATSGQSGSEARDRRMHANVLESARYPEIVLRPDRVEGRVAAQGASQVRLHGTFEIHGQAHEVVVPLEVDGEGGQFTVTGSFPVPYVKWGMRNPSTLFLRVSDTVVITIHTVARPVAAASDEQVELRPGKQNSPVTHYALNEWLSVTNSTAIEAGSHSPSNA